MKLLKLVDTSKLRAIFFSLYKRQLLLSGFIIIPIFFFPYFIDYWWKFACSSLLIFLTALLMWQKQWRSFLGLVIPAKEILICSIFFIVLFFGFKTLIFQHLKQIGIQFHKTGTIWNIAIIFQVLNEEIVLRAILLRYMKKFLNSVNFIIFATAGIFSALHFFFYKITQGVSLNSLTLISLFMFWLISNRLFLKFNHIGFSYILHAAWNLTRFTGEYFYNNQKISEGSLFNLLEGSPTVILTLILFYLILSFLLQKPNKL